MKITELLKEPGPAEQKALAVCARLLKSDVLAPLLLTDEGKPALMWDKSHVTKMNLIAKANGGVIAVLPPDVFAEPSDDQGAVLVSSCRVPVFVMVSKLVDSKDYMIYLSRLAEKVQAWMAAWASDNFTGITLPYLESVEALALSEGKEMENFVSLMLFYKQKYLTSY